MDYGVHGWDVREGLRMAHFMDPDAADMLVPFMFVLWQATTDTSRLQGADLDVAVRVSGRNAGTTRIKVTKDGRCSNQARKRVRRLCSTLIRRVSF